jgi:hypothetical protein
VLVGLYHLAPLAEEMGKKQPTQAPPAQHAAGNQLTDNLLLISAALRSATNGFTM